MKLLPLAVGFVLAASAFQSAAASKPDLPSTVSWTAFAAGTSGYNQAVALGNVMREDIGTAMRVVPGETDVARLVPVRQGRIDFAASGAGSYFAQEGVLDFARPDLGPQNLRLVAMNMADAHMGVVTRGDSGVRTLRDLRGKRVAYVAGTPSLNTIMKATLAYADLTWDDVERVEVPGFKAAMDGILQGRIDGAILTAASGFATQIEATSGGIHWPQYPQDDDAAWKRLHSVAPFLVKHTGTSGAGVDPNGSEGLGQPLPLLASYADKDEDLVYNMTKALFHYYDQYKDAAPGAEGWALERQVFDWGMPFHPGAIRYYKEAGVWTDDLDEMNADLISRQEIIQQAWSAFRSGSDSSGDDFERRWLAARAKALEDAGREPVWR
ncbi:MAG: TAXI family TRAP transporter solute-binding subunit [Aquisalimonadaceae bacterium]